MGELSRDIIRNDKNKKNVSIKVNLKEMFDIPFFPEDDGLRQAIGQAIIDKITANTLNSKFLSGSSSKGYSKEYAESDEGLIYGKKKGEKANLKASGDMLASMEVYLPSDANYVVIDFTDSLESEKAHGHITGNKNGPGVKRDFFGLDNKDLKSIMSDFESTVMDAAAATLANDTVSQGDQSNLDFVLGLLNGQSNQG